MAGSAEEDEEEEECSIYIAQPSVTTCTMVYVDLSLTYTLWKQGTTAACPEDKDRASYRARAQTEWGERANTVMRDMDTTMHVMLRLDFLVVKRSPRVRGIRDRSL